MIRNLIFAFLVLVLSFTAFPNPSYSQDDSPVEESSEATTAGDIKDSSSSAESESQDYVLPYPGLLSDSPLYFIKALRDRIIELAISDPLKKADFYLLTSDKRLLEGNMLLQKGTSKYSLAETTVSKGENYFEKGIQQLQQAKKQSLPVDSLMQKYIVSSKKHQELIHGMVDKTDGKVKSGLEYSQKRSSEFEKMLTKLLPSS